MCSTCVSEYTSYLPPISRRLPHSLAFPQVSEPNISLGVTVEKIHRPQCPANPHLAVKPAVLNNPPTLARSYRNSHPTSALHTSHQSVCRISPQQMVPSRIHHLNFSRNAAGDFIHPLKTVSAPSPTPRSTRSRALWARHRPTTIPQAILVIHRSATSPVPHNRKNHQQALMPRPNRASLKRYRSRRMKRKRKRSYATPKL